MWSRNRDECSSLHLLGVKSLQARQFYETEALRGGWSVRQLKRQINSQFYERTALSRNKAAVLDKGAQRRPGDELTPAAGDQGSFRSGVSGSEG